MKNICKNCFYFGKHNSIRYKESGNCSCPKFLYGYHLVEADFPKSNDWIHIEDDEGWGCYVASNFGCIHFKDKK
jgi:hypothetical protein